MKRTLGIFAASSLLLTACGGGGLQSPDFTPVLTGIFITSTGDNNPSDSALSVAPGGTLQLVSRGLFSTPPGTSPNSAGVVACDDPLTVASEVCTLGDASGVTFSIDSPTSIDNRPLASVNAQGLVSGLRRGQAVLRARFGDLPDSTRPLIVNGPVLQSIAVTALDVKNNSPLPRAGQTVSSVPVGRSIALTGVATCSSGFTGGPAGTEVNNNATCTNQNYNFSWALPIATPADTVAFTPASAAGETIAVRTQRFGPFSIGVSFTNEEGELKEGSISLEATARVLEDIIVQADPVQPEPVAVVNGTQTRFVALGVFSDGTTGSLIEADLSNRRTTETANNKAPSARLTWSADASAVGGPITITEPANNAFNNAVLVSAGSVLGANGINATGFNTERIARAGSTANAGDPGFEPLLVEDRAALNVVDLDLTAITRICLATDVGAECSVNTQVQENGDPVKYVARGTFQGDAVGTERNIDPALIPIQFSTTTAPLLAVNVDADADGKDGNAGTPDPDASIDFDDVGAVRGLAQGVARLVASLPNGIAPTITDRSEMIDIAVTERSCQDQFLTANGTVASADNGDLIGISDVNDEGSVIDGIANTSGRFTVGPSVLGGTLSMDFRRDATQLLAGGGTLNVGFTLFDEFDYVSSSTVSIQTLNSTGGVVQSFNNISPSGLTVGAANKLVQAQATQPFSGVRLSIDVPLLLGLPTTLLPELLPEGELSLLGGREIRVFSACGQVVPVP